MRTTRKPYPAYKDSVRPFTDNDVPRFFFYVLYSAAKRGLFVATGNQNTIDHLTVEKLCQHRFAFPPSEEQQQIANYLDEANTKIDILISKLEKTIELVRDYRTAVISAAVTGKIDVRQEA